MFLPKSIWNYLTSILGLCRFPRPVRTPTVLQMEGVECGAASLGIILNHYGNAVPLLELRQQCNVTRDGSNAADILRVARNYGMSAKGYKKSIQRLETLSPPYVIFWNLNHFVVVEGFSSRQVFLNDPATGRRTVSWEEFDQSFTGLVLVIKPGPAFVRNTRRRTLFSMLGRRLRHSWGAIGFAVLAGICLTLARLLLPVFTQVFVDEILIEGRQDWVRPLLLGMTVTLLIQGLVAKLQLDALRRLTIKLLIVSKSQFLWHLLHLPISFYSQRLTGDLSRRAELNDEVVSALSRLSTTAVDTLMLVFYVIVMWMYDRPLTLLTLIFSAFNLLALQQVRRMRVEATLRLNQDKGKLSGISMAGIQAIETVKASGLEPHLFELFAGLHARILKTQQDFFLPTRVLATVPILLRGCVITAVLAFGGWRTIQGHLSLGMLIAFQSLVQGFLRPINHLVDFGSLVQQLESNLERLDDVLQNPLDPEIKATPLSLEASRLTGHIDLKDLTFGYHPHQPLIQDFCLTVTPGQRVALVGKTGSGKSTLLHLMAGLYPPWQGEICFDGMPREQLSRIALSSSLTLVEQDIFLFSGTVRDNLTLWDNTVSDEQLVQACKDAAIHDCILSLGGYEAKLCEGGYNLSGGERQRLEIARALVRNPKILILDEATSALDAETEFLVDRALRRRGCSCIIVAHRLSTIRDCDEIIVLDQGKVAERGTHRELCCLGGLYAQLIIEEQESLQVSPTRLLQSQNQNLKDLPLRPINPAVLARDDGKSSPPANWISEPTPEKLGEGSTIFLDVPETLWIVRSGTLSLFSLPTEGADVTGRYLFNVEVGEAVVGLSTEDCAPRYSHSCLQGIATESTVLQRFSFPEFIAQVQLQNTDALWLLIKWITRIRNFIVRDQFPPVASIVRASEPGNLALKAGQCLVPSQLRWVKVRQGRARWLGIHDFLLEPLFPWFPLTAETWLQAASDSEVRVASTEEVIAHKDWVSSLRCLQQFLTTYLEGLQYLEQTTSTLGIAKTEQFNQMSSSHALRGLAAVLSPNFTPQSSLEPPLLAAVRAVGLAVGITITPPRDQDRLHHPDANHRILQQAVVEIAQASQCALRRVTLSSNWWHHQYGPLLAFAHQEHHPVALLPYKNRYTLFNPVGGERIDVNQSVAQVIAVEAYQFYRPLPPKVDRVSQILRFGFRGTRKDWTALIMMGIAGTLLGMATPQATAFLVNQVIPNRDHLLLQHIGLGLFAIALSIAGLQLSQGILLLRLENTADGSLQTAVWDRLLRLPPRFFQQQTTGDLSMRLLAISQIRSLLSGATQRTLLSGLFAFCNLILMWLYSPQLAQITLLSTMLLILMTAIVYQQLSSRYRNQAAIGGTLTGLTVQLLRGIQKLRVAAAEERALAIWANRFRHYVDLSADIKRISDRNTIFNEIIPFGTSIFIFGVMGYLLPSPPTPDGPISVGLFLAFNAAFWIFMNSITAMSNTLATIADLLPLWKRAKRILQTAPETDGSERHPGSLQGSILMENVCFRYSGYEPLAVSNVNLEVHPGESIAIVGLSGSGKSTLMRLLLGFERPQRGRILFDGHELTNLNLQALRQQMGVVLQNAQVIAGSILDNITCGGSASYEAAWEAAKLSGLADDIAQMPMKMFTRISEGGSNFSTGQRQRLLIARAIVSRPRILLLDEATSALDNQTQVWVMRNLDQLEASCIIVAHRLSTIFHADRIYVMDAGRIVQVGTFATLMNQAGVFSRLVSRQLMTTETEDNLSDSHRKTLGYKDMRNESSKP